MVRRAMIEHFVRALLAGELSSFVSTCGTEHAQTASARQLHCRRPDTSARAVHQYSFARLSVATLEQPTIAVAYGVPMAAPCANEIFAGNGCTCSVVQSANSAYVPLTDLAV